MVCDAYVCLTARMTRLTLFCTGLKCIKRFRWSRWGLLSNLRCPARPQVFSMFLPDVNIKRTSAWYKEADPEDISLDDSQV